MKKLLALLLALSLLALLPGCTQPAEPEVKYFPLEVTHEMAPDYVLKYVYHYNEDWIQTGMTTYLNGELNQEVTYELDLENNQILKSIATAPDGATAEIEYRHTYDKNGNVLLTEQYAEGILALSTEYTYDSQGNRITHTQKNPSNGITTILTYDADGNILTNESIIEAVGERPASRAWMENTYDKNGNLIQSVNYYNNGEAHKTSVMEYDSQGRKIRETTTDTYEGVERLDSVREYTYDGKTEIELVYDANGNLQITGTRTYDNAGNLLSSESVSEYSTQRSTYTYQKVEIPAK